MKNGNSIVIEGITLTPELVNRIQGYQAENNEHIEIVREVIAEAVCFIGMHIDGSTDYEKEEINNLVAGLSHIRNELNDFRMPKN